MRGNSKRTKQNDTHLLGILKPATNVCISKELGIPQGDEMPLREDEPTEEDRSQKDQKAFIMINGLRSMQKIVSGIKKRLEASADEDHDSAKNNDSQSRNGEIKSAANVSSAAFSVSKR